MNLMSNQIFPLQRILSKKFFHQIIPHQSKASSTFAQVCCDHVKLTEFVEEGERPVVSISHLCRRAFDNLLEKNKPIVGLGVDFEVGDQSLSRMVRLDLQRFSWPARVAMNGWLRTIIPL
ncbi:hypothetical protein AVEN_30816-1, partial [Araneus ventricosus]